MSATSTMGRLDRDPMPGRLSPLEASRFGFDEARHLLWRAGFGGTPEQIELLATWGLERSVDRLLGPWEGVAEEAGEGSFDRDIMRPLSEAERQAYRIAQANRDENTLARFRAMRQEAQRADRRQMADMQVWWLERMIETPRPLEEKMALLWHGHFATGYRKIENSYHMYMQNRMFRAHALGSFADLLSGIVRDPAMIRYLDNQASNRRRPNENLARELMELFSLGVGNYTERDIKEGARALTGYTFEDDRFVFNRENHDDGAKTILGRTGAWDGDDFVRIILANRATPRFVARKLYCHFVADVPEAFDEIPEASRRVIDDLAGELSRGGYALRPALRRLFTSEHFYHPAIVGEKVKSPAELVVGAVRSLRTPVRDLRVLTDAMELMGQNLFNPPSVKGWTGGRAWVNTSTLFVRQNVLNFLLTGKLPEGYDALASEQRYDAGPLLRALEAADASSVQEPGRVVEYLLRFMLGRVPPRASAEITAFVGRHASGGRIDEDVLTAAVLLITAMPEYQLC